MSLTVSRRLAPAVLDATRRVAAQLPGAFAASRALAPWPRRTVGRRAVIEHRPTELRRPARWSSGPCRRAAREAAFIADELRRAHLQDGVPWSQMAVLVRSPAASSADAPPGLRDGRCSAGCFRPGHGADRRPGGRVLLSVLRCGQSPALLTGAAGAGAAGLTRRRHGRRGVAPAAPAAARRPPGCGLDAGSAGRRCWPARRCRSGSAGDLRGPVLRVRVDARRGPAGAADPAAEPVCGRSGAHSGLEDPLLAASLRGGRAGQRADSTLDACWRCSRMAADLADRMPLAGVGAFLDLVEGQRIPGDPTAGTARSADAVAVLSAHAAKGLEWDVVCLAGVAEGSWPVVRTQASLLGTDEVLDAAAGLPPPAIDGRRPCRRNAGCSTWRPPGPDSG